jgi:hypothetical protein
VQEKNLEDVEKEHKTCYDVIRMGSEVDPCGRKNCDDLIVQIRSFLKKRVFVRVGSVRPCGVHCWRSALHHIQFCEVKPVH